MDAHVAAEQLVLQTRNLIQKYTGSSRAAAMVRVAGLAPGDISALNTLGEALAGEPNADAARQAFRDRLAEAEQRAALARVEAHAAQVAARADDAETASGDDAGELDPEHPPLPEAQSAVDAAG